MDSGGYNINKITINMKLLKKNTTKFLINSSVKEKHELNDFVLIKSEGFSFCSPLNTIPTGENLENNIFFPELLSEFSNIPSDVTIENIFHKDTTINNELIF